MANDPISEFTVGTLYLHVVQRFEGLERRLAAGIAATEHSLNIALVESQRAVEKSEAAANQRFHSLNDMKSAMADQASHYVTRNEINTRFDAMTIQVASNTERITRAEGKSTGGNAMWGYVVGLGSMLALIMDAILSYAKAK